MMNTDALHTALRIAMQNYLDKKKRIQTIPGSNLKDDKGNVIPASDLTTENLGLGNGGKIMDLDPLKAEADMIDAFAQAIAEEVIKHIQELAEIKGGKVTTASLPYTNTLQGVGGGVVGPVQVFPGNLSVAKGTIDVEPKGIQ